MSIRLIRYYQITCNDCQDQRFASYIDESRSDVRRIAATLEGWTSALVQHAHPKMGRTEDYCPGCTQARAMVEA